MQENGLILKIHKKKQLKVSEIIGIRTHYTCFRIIFENKWYNTKVLYNNECHDNLYNIDHDMCPQLKIQKYVEIAYFTYK